eukprot:2892012-Amphidinium_carterae.1
MQTSLLCKCSRQHCMEVDGRLHRCPNVADLTTDVALRLLGIMQAESCLLYTSPSPRDRG